MKGQGSELYNSLTETLIVWRRQGHPEGLPGGPEVPTLRHTP